MVLVLIMLVALFAPSGTVRAASFTNVACSADALIAAIEAANATPVDDILYLAAGCTYVLTAVNNTTAGPNGLPVIADAATAGKLTLNGSGHRIVPGDFFTFLPAIIKGGTPGVQTVQANGATIARDSAGGTPDFRILQVANGGNLTLANLTLQNGNLPTQAGGGIFNNAGTLTVTYSTLSGNTADLGGGIFSLGTLTVRDSTFSGNTASQGDGIFVGLGTATLTNLTFSGDSIFTCPAFPYTVPAGDTQMLIGAMHCANIAPEDNVINLTNSTYTLTAANNAAGGKGPNGLPLIIDTAYGGKLILHGNGAAIERSSANGTPDFRILMVASGGDLAADGLTVKNGNISVWSGGGIYNTGTLTLNNSTISGNSAPYGGGIANDVGTLTITHSTFINNATVHDGAGINSAGNTLVVSDSTFSGNVAQGLAGGMIVHGGTAMVTNTTFSSNTAASTFAGGAGMLIVYTTATVTGCTFSDNHTDGTGGGIFLGGSSSLTVNNSTFFNNTATYGGGGVWSGGTLLLAHSTLTGNSAGVQGGGIDFTGGEVTLDGTIVAGNTSPSGPDIFGTVNSLGYNLIGNTAGATITGSTTGNLTDGAATPLNLGLLQNNGGLTKTMALGAGSVAIDAGDPAFAPPPEYDQRGVGFPRVVGGRIDIGAYEK